MIAMPPVRQILRHPVFLALAPGIFTTGALVLWGSVHPVASIPIIAMFAAGGLILAARYRDRRRGSATVQTRSTLDVVRIVLDAIPLPVILVDTERRSGAVNDAARTALGIRTEGRNLASDLRNPVVLEAVDRVLAGGSPVSEEFSIAGTVSHSFVAHVVPVRDETRHLATRAMVLFQDVTAARRVEEFRADFVANVSHELRSPLAALVGFIETLQGPARDDADAHDRFLAIMKEEAARMTRLIEDLLSLSRVEANEHVRPAGEVVISELLKEIADTLATGLHARAQMVKIDVPAALPTVTGDRDELRQVFQNLIDNALKYGGNGGPVEVSARSVDRIPDTGTRGVAVSVRDHGEGVPREAIPRLTERFFRVDKGRSRKMGGTGLGLAIVKHIVSRHRGRLEIDSVLGQGSTFTTYLPAHKQQEGTGVSTAPG
jgi:two-component system phosphate regulon sensor histidine kinase PhoR